MTIIVLMCLAIGLIGTIVSFIGYKIIKQEKLSIILLSIGAFILLLSNYFLYTNITKDQKELEKDLNSSISNSKQDSSYKGLEKIRAEKNKAMKEAKGN